MLALYLRIRNLLTREEGQDLIEYALLVALLVVAAIVGLSALGGDIAALWTSISGTITGSVTPS